MSSPNAPQSRRTFLKRSSVGVAGTAVAGGLPALAFGTQAALAADEASATPIVRENQFTDQSTWTSGYRVENISSVVEGYAKQTSVNLGEPIDLVISGPNRYLSGPGEELSEGAIIEVYRLGYYGGKGSRLVWSSGQPVSTWQRFNSLGEPANSYDADPGLEPPILPEDPDTGVLGRANNRVSLTIPGDVIPASGVYLAKVKGQWYDFPPGVPAVRKYGESHITFTVRDDARPRDLLVLLPTNTWQAYNYWGGRSTYTYNSRYGNAGSIVPATGSERAAKVSFDRPYNNWIGDYNWVLRTEFPAIWWLEQQGYDISYTDDVALHFDPAQALRDKSRSLLILGHGEYWTKNQRDGVEAARDSGTNVYNFGANTAYWRVRYEDTTGRAATSIDKARVMVCYKIIEGGGTTQPTVAGKVDPVEPTTTWRDPGKGRSVVTPGTTAATVPIYTGNNRPERELLGVQYIGDDDATSRGLTVPADNGKGEFAGHWAWKGTSVPKGGATIGTELVGWEWDGIPNPGQPFSGNPPKTKTGTTLQRLSETDPRLNQPPGAQTVYVQDAGRTYGGRGASAAPPAGGTPFAHAITYTAPSGALVFSAGTIHWSWGLGPHHLHRNTDTHATPPVDSSDARIRQATANLLAGGGNVPATPTVPGGNGPGPEEPPPTDTTPPNVTISLTNQRSLLFGAYLVRSDKVINVKFNCTSAEKSGPVSVKLSIVLNKVEIGTATTQVNPGQTTQPVKVVITAAGYKTIAKQLLYIGTDFVVTATDAVGNARTTTTNIRLRD